MTRRPAGHAGEGAATLRRLDRRDLLQAVVELAASGRGGEGGAPRSTSIFFDRYEQRLLLEALARHFPPILGATRRSTTS